MVSLRIAELWLLCRSFHIAIVGQCSFFPFRRYISVMMMFVFDVIIDGSRFHADVIR